MRSTSADTGTPRSRVDVTMNGVRTVEELHMVHVRPDRPGAAPSSLKAVAADELRTRRCDLEAGRRDDHCGVCRGSGCAARSGVADVRHGVVLQPRQFARAHAGSPARSTTIGPRTGLGSSSEHGHELARGGVDFRGLGDGLVEDRQVVVEDRAPVLGRRRSRTRSARWRKVGNSAEPRSRTVLADGRVPWLAAEAARHRLLGAFCDVTTLDRGDEHWR